MLGDSLNEKVRKAAKDCLQSVYSSSHKLQTSGLQGFGGDSASSTPQAKSTFKTGQSFDRTSTFDHSSGGFSSNNKFGMIIKCDSDLIQY